MRIDKMEKILLSKQNAHRVTMVRPANAPESAPVPFKWRGKSFGFCNYINLVGDGENQRSLPVAEFKDWEVTEVSHPGYLEDYWQSTISSYNWNSQHPEEQGESSIAGYEDELHKDLMGMPEQQRERYMENYKRYYMEMISANSRCASAFVTGPANFNSRRNDKANSVYDKRRSAFREWRQRALEAIKKQLEFQKPEEVKNAETWEKIKKDINETVESINQGYTKALLVSNLFGRIGTYANNGNVEIVDKAIAHIREWNTKLKKPVITERHKLFKLPEVARNILSREEERSNRENKEVHLEGVTVVWNYEIERIQLFFDEKPDEEARNRLHRDFRFNWSRKEGAWQRILTPNAIRAAKQFLKVDTL